jgi:hypothetical protein
MQGLFLLIFSTCGNIHLKKTRLFFFVPFPKNDFCFFRSLFAFANISLINLVSLFRCSSSKTNTVYGRRINSFVLVCSLSSHRHFFIPLIFGSCLSIHNKLNRHFFFPWLLCSTQLVRHSCVQHTPTSRLLTPFSLLFSSLLGNSSRAEIPSPGRDGTHVRHDHLGCRDRYLQKRYEIVRNDFDWRWNTSFLYFRAQSLGTRGRRSQGTPKGIWTSVLVSSAVRSSWP